MHYGQLPGIDQPISRLVQGTAMLTRDNLDASFSLLDGVLALGGNTFDNAYVYGHGDTERIFGEWLNERGVRDQVVILTKGAHHNEDRHRVTPYDIASDLFDSLARFKTDFIEMFVLHRDDPTQPVGPIIDVLNQYQREGLIGAFGASNWTHDRIQAANDYAAALETDLAPEEMAWLDLNMDALP
ncbi:MAG: aldo/keto reductase [Anaerolineae bacterium]|nr:aldo/keto reductase [Anaerolineae bacterium]